MMKLMLVGVVAGALAGCKTVPASVDAVHSSSQTDVSAPAAGGETPAPTPTTPSATSPDAASERPLYYARALTDADLADRSLRELSLLRNTIFARGGNPFHKKWLREYFAAQSWYTEREKTDTSGFADYDWDNIKAIARVENGLSREDLLRRKDELLARQQAGAPRAHDELELRLLSRRLGQWVSSDGAERGQNPLEDPSLLDGVLSLDALGDLSRRDLRILRNTIYARHGYMFRSEILGEYFGNMDWYHPDESYSDDRLTAVDRKNIRLIKSVEDEHGGPLSEREHAGGHEYDFMEGA